MATEVIANMLMQMDVTVDLDMKALYEAVVSMHRLQATWRRLDKKNNIKKGYAL